MFAATGVTKGYLLDGVRFFGDGAKTESIVMRSQVRHRARDQRDPPLQHQAEVLVGHRPRVVSTAPPLLGRGQRFALGCVS